MFGLIKEFDGKIRAVPIIFFFVFVYLWHNLALSLSGKKISFFDKLFIVLMFFSILISYTRGIYIALALVSYLLAAILFFHGHLKVNRTVIGLYLAFILSIIIIPTGKLDKCINRTKSGVEAILGNEVKKGVPNTYQGRIALFGERAYMILKKNPIIGFGFIHEEILRARKIRVMVGNIDDAGYIKMYSADFAWANIIVYTGFLGLTVFIFLIICFIINFFSSSKNNNNDFYFYRLSCFLQVITLIILMCNGDRFTSQVQIPFLMLAGYTYTSHKYAQTQE
ncbi:MAG: O-antigen ligase family protein [bacterium]